MRKIPLQKDVQQRNRDKHPYSRTYSQCTKRAKKYNLPICSKDKLENWHKEQRRHCVYCGMSEEEAMSRYQHRLHTDRIISEKGYVLDNLALACQRCNMVKSKYLTGEQMKFIADLFFDPTEHRVASEVRRRYDEHATLKAKADMFDKFVKLDSAVISDLSHYRRMFKDQFPNSESLPYTNRFLHVLDVLLSKAKEIK